MPAGTAVTGPLCGAGLVQPPPVNVAGVAPVAGISPVAQPGGTASFVISCAGSGLAGIAAAPRTPPVAGAAAGPAVRAGAGSLTNAAPGAVAWDPNPISPNRSEA